MTSNDICNKAKSIAATKNIYIRGAKGQRLDGATKMRFCSIDPFNAKRTAQIMAVSEDTLGFDEYGLISVVSGYNCRNFGEIMALCEDISKDFGDILPGEVVFMQDRIGIYVGNKQVIAANPIGIGYTILDGWVSHGKFPEVDYTQPKPVEEAPAQKEGVKNEQNEDRNMESRRDRVRNRH